MNKYRYILEPYNGPNTRYRCPDCQHRDKTFSLYIDTETNEHIHPSVGRCNRESNCGYHYTPKQYFQDNNFSLDTPRPQWVTKPGAARPKQRPVSFIPVEIFKESLKDHNQNNFVKFLLTIFESEKVNEAIENYFIGTSEHWPGAIVFWQIDNNGKIRTGKIMQYDAMSGKRVKHPYNHITWAHTLLKQPDFELRQCLFGEHLLKVEPLKPVAIVESEKTAVIASIYLPQFIWLAAGSLTNLTIERCSILKGRAIALFPDLNGFDKWTDKAKELAHLATFTVSDLLERGATKAERKQGLDLADYLIRFDCKTFALSELTEQPAADQPLVEVKRLEPIDSSCNFSKPENPKPQTWDQDIADLETFFKSITIPTQPLKLNACSTIANVSSFIDSHFAIVINYNGNRTYLPCLCRLRELKNHLTIKH